MPRRDEYEDDDDYEDRSPRSRRNDRNEYDDDDYDDYDDKPRRRRGGRSAALQKVSLPATFMMIVGGLGVAMFILNLVVELGGFNEGPNPFQPKGAAQNPAAEGAGKVIGFVIQPIWCLIVFFGGLQMKNLKGRGFVIFSCIWAMLPCNLCCLLGIPFGIWALVVLFDDNVKRAFSN